MKQAEYLLPMSKEVEKCDVIMCPEREREREYKQLQTALTTTLSYQGVHMGVLLTACNKTPARSG